MSRSGITGSQCAQVVVKNQRNARCNPLSAYPLDTDLAQVESSPYLAYPLREAELAKSADGCVVVVVANEAKARKAPSQPLWILGSGFATDSPTLNRAIGSNAEYARLSARVAYVKRVLSPPMRSIFSKSTTPMPIRSCNILIALGYTTNRPKPAAPSRRVKPARMEKCGERLRRRIGDGHGAGRSGLYRVSFELALQLRGTAGERQLSRAKIGLAQPWRGVPTPAARWSSSAWSLPVTKRKVAVIGAGMTKFMHRALETPKELAWPAARSALAASELKLKQIDCVVLGSAPDA